MFRKIRGKLASSISVIPEEEDFLYNSSLRVPANSPVSFGNISTSSILDTSHITYSFEKPILSKPFFKLGKSKLSPEDINYVFSKKMKTNAVFFQLLYVPPKIYNPDIDMKPSGNKAKQIKHQVKKAANKDAGVKSKLQKPTDFLYGLAEPDTKDYLQNLKPKVEKIELLNMEDHLSEGNDTVVEKINVKDIISVTREINVKDIVSVTREMNVKSFGKLKIKND